MENSILFAILQSLSATDRQSLRKFLHSPYHNKREDVQRLFDYLTHEKQSLTDRASVFSHLFPQQPFDAAALNHTVSLLTKRVEHWLALEQAQSEAPYWETCLARAYRQRDLAKLLQRSVQTATKTLSAQAYRNSGYYRAQMDLQQEAFFGLRRHGRNKGIDLHTLSEAQDLALIAEKLRVGCLLISHRNLTRVEYRSELLDVTLALLHHHPYLEIPAIAVYYHGYLAQTAPEPEPHFYALAHLLQAHAALFPMEELHDIYLIAINFCIKKINLGGEAWFHNIFDLYKKGLDIGVFMENERLSRWTFNNIVSTAIRVRELDWAKSFMRDYAAALDPATREATRAFNLARVFYEEKNYAEALRVLHQMEYDDVLEILNAKALRMKLFYKLGEWQALDSLLDSITVYLRRKKVLGYHKENFANTVSAMRKLISLNPYDPTARAAFAETVQAYKVLTERKWFLEQVL